MKFIPLGLVVDPESLTLADIGVLEPEPGDELDLQADAPEEPRDILVLWC
jgi:hypothetical protein